MELTHHWSINRTNRYIWDEKLDSGDQNIIEKSFENNAHMVTIGLNFHF